MLFFPRQTTTLTYPSLKTPGMSSHVSPTRDTEPNTRSPVRPAHSPAPRAEPLTLPQSGVADAAIISGYQASRLVGHPDPPSVSLVTAFRSWSLIGRDALATGRRGRRRRRAGLCAPQQGAGPRARVPEEEAPRPRLRDCVRAPREGSLSSAAETIQTLRALCSLSVPAGLLATSDLEGRSAACGGRGEEEDPKRQTSRRARGDYEESPS